MSGIPKKGRRNPHEGAKYLTQIVGERSREIRTLYTSIRDQDEVSQEEIAERMVILGHATWRRQTVALVEKAGRNLTVDELISMAAALQTTLAYLLNPGSVWAHNYNEPVDVGAPNPLESRQLKDLYGFNPVPWPAANGAFDWPDMRWTEADVRQPPIRHISPPIPAEHPDEQ